MLFLKIDMIQKSVQRQRVEALRKAHFENLPLILPNVWDALGAGLIQDLGYPVVATSSSALAQSAGYTDGQNIPFHTMLARLASMTQTVHIPVTADIENGFASNDDELVHNINKLLDIGIAGINFEDSNKPENELIPIDIQVNRIRLIKKTALESDRDIFINARIDTYVHGDHLSHEEKLIESIKRGLAYKEAGAECVFPILITSRDHIAALIKAVGLPLNVMTFPGIPSLEDLKLLGVSRISLGGSFIKIAIQAMKNFASEIKSLKGESKFFDNEITSSYLNHLISQTND
jgi:2-methylisocitrate lyase-like PEP mutase family enzyme